MYWTWNFWTCCRTASRNSTETQRKGDGISREPIREQRGDVREQVSHLVWADLQVRCSPSSESEMASSATSPTSSMDTEKFYVFVFSGMYIFCHKGSLNQNNLTKDVLVCYFEVAWDYGSCCFLHCLLRCILLISSCYHANALNEDGEHVSIFEDWAGDPLTLEHISCSAVAMVLAGALQRNTWHFNTQLSLSPATKAKSLKGQHTQWIGWWANDHVTSR